MINKIRKKMVRYYTLIMLLVLLPMFLTTYGIYQHTTLRNVRQSLQNYLHEEVWEAQNFSIPKNVKVERHEMSADVQSFRFFTCWLSDGRLIHSETPNANIAQKLLLKLQKSQYKEHNVYHLNIKDGKTKWYFLISTQQIVLADGKKIDVFAIVNYTPIREDMRHYVRIGILLSLIVVLLIFMISNLLVSKSMKYIELTYQKQKHFVSDAAHELRTPVSILYSYAELLEYKKNKKPVINEIKDELLQMNNLIDRLLMLARYDNENGNFKKEEVSLNEVITSLLKPLSGIHGKDTFTFQSENKNILLMGDNVMIKQLFSIILDNALKYTGDNKKINLTLTSAFENISVKISDNGIGIADKDLPHVFDRFWRAEESRHQKGLGLGLSLADVIVKQHHGKINVTSKVGHGTTFEIVLPIK